MKRSTHRWAHAAAVCFSVAGPLALATTPVSAQPGGQSPSPRATATEPGHPEGLIGKAAQLDTLTPEQRAQVEQLVQQCKAATTPLRQADAKLLTQLALQVETAKVDPPSLQPYLSAEQNAAPNAHDVRTSALNRLHELLTSAQRNQLVDRVESQWSKTETGGASDSDSDETVEANRLNLTQAQKVRIKANFQALRANEGASPRAAMRTALESFRSDSFDATGLVPNGTRGEWAEKAAQAIVPVLTPTQRVAFANHLRTRAARESQG